jgi:5-hydroxyisourate hydrolase
MRETDGSWTEVGRGQTDAEGRLRTLSDNHKLELRVYRLTFDTATYFAGLGIEGFYPEVPILFHVAHVEQHFHVPLLLSPYGYSTYRGS